MEPSSQEKSTTKINGIIKKLKLTDEETASFYSATQHGRIQSWLDDKRTKLTTLDIKWLNTYQTAYQQQQIQTKSTRQKLIGRIAIVAGFLFLAVGIAITLLTGGFTTVLTLPLMAIGAETAVIGVGIASLLGLSSLIIGSFALNYSHKNQAKADEMSQLVDSAFADENDLLADPDNLSDKELPKPPGLNKDLSRGSALKANSDKSMGSQIEQFEITTSTDGAFSTDIPDAIKNYMTVTGQFDASASEAEEDATNEPKPVITLSESNPNEPIIVLKGKTQEIITQIETDNACKITHQHSFTSVLNQIKKNKSEPPLNIPPPDLNQVASPIPRQVAITKTPAPKSDISLSNTSSLGNQNQSEPVKEKHLHQKALQKVKSLYKTKQPQSKKADMNLKGPIKSTNKLKLNTYKNLFYSIAEIQNLLKLLKIPLADDHPFSLAEAAQTVKQKEHNYPQPEKSPLYKLAFFIHELALFQSISHTNSHEWVQSNLKEMGTNLEHITDNDQLKCYYTALFAACHSKGRLKIAEKLKHSNYKNVTEFWQDILSHIKHKNKGNDDFCEAITQHFKTINDVPFNLSQQESTHESQRAAAPPAAVASNPSHFFNKNTEGGSSADASKGSIRLYHA